MSIETVSSLPAEAEGRDEVGLIPWRWTLGEFEQAEALGWFDGKHVELIQGEVYYKVTQKPPHYTAIRRIARALERVFDEGYDVRQQGPIPIPNDSKPEPDILVAVGSYLDYAERHPTPAETVLIVEVADTTLRMDSTRKRAVYARAGFQEYWISDSAARHLIVHRRPVALPERVETFDYSSIRVYSEEESVTPLARTEVSIPIRDLLLPQTITATPQTETAGE